MHTLKFIHSLILQILLNAFNVSSSVLDTGDMVVNKTDENHVFPRSILILTITNNIFLQDVGA
jgi:hypothetical protein